jgi:hypothetical protein
MESIAGAGSLRGQMVIANRRTRIAHATRLARNFYRHWTVGRAAAKKSCLRPASHNFNYVCFGNLFAIMVIGERSHNEVVHCLSEAAHTRSSIAKTDRTGVYDAGQKI